MFSLDLVVHHSTWRICFLQNALFNLNFGVRCQIKAFSHCREASQQFGCQQTPRRWGGARSITPLVSMHATRDSTQGFDRFEEVGGCRAL